MRFLRSPWILAMVCLLTVSRATPAVAQISADGPAVTIPWPAGYPGNNNTRGTDSAHDPVSGNYLVVAANGPQGVSGVLVDGTGTPVGSAFQISTQPYHVNYARVKYGAAVNGTGGFLVAWISEDGSAPLLQVHIRLVTPSGALLGNETVISDAGAQALLEAGPAIGYSPTSQRFLVVWQGRGGPIGKGYRGIKARFVGVDGTAQEAGAFDSAVCGEPDKWCRDPGITWNPNLNEFAVSFSSENQTSNVCGSGLVLTSATTLVGFRVTTFNSVPCTVLPAMTDVAFSPLTDRYVMVWYELIGGGLPCLSCRARSATFDPAGNLLQADVLSYEIGSYDSLAMAFNPISLTSLVVGLNKQSDDIAGLEVDGLGQQIGPRDTFAAGERGWLARVSSSQTQAKWLPSYQDVAGPNNNISDPSVIPVKTLTVTVPPVDTDGDGVYDGIDACPSTPGIAPTGCPDSDGDNVADNIDACPSTPGIAPSGCPDTDGDGKTDNIDACPAVFGTTANGCPDSDGDTVPDNLDSCPTTVGVTPSGCPASVSIPPPDLSGDNRADLVFQNATGQLYGWFMDSWMVTGTGFISSTTRTADWTVVGARDFTGDNKSDLLWYNTATGELNLWHMDPANGKTGEQTFGPVALAWAPVATGDINGDGAADIIWHNATAGQAFVWFMKPAGGQAGFAGVGGAFLGDSLRDDTTGNVVSIGASTVRIAGTGDVNLDGKTDILLQDDASGAVGVLLMNRQRVIALNPLNPPSASTAWKIRAVADFNGDSRPDLIWRNETTGHLYIWYLNGLDLYLHGFLNGGMPVNLVWRLVGVR